MRIPPKLQPGDKIALLAPSSPLQPENPVEEIARAMERLGYCPQIMDSCRGSTARGYSAAAAEVKARDLMCAFTDPDIRGIWCVRGGSTAAEMLPLLDFRQIEANAKVFIGFSDITSLHLALQQRCSLVTYHGPNANRAIRWAEDDFSLRSLRSALLMEEELEIVNPPEEPMRTLCPGEAAGRLTGGNLSLVTATLGTPWQIDTRGKILYLEDIEEPLDAVEKMLRQLRYAGLLEQAAGLIFGEFTDCKNRYDVGYGPEDLLREMFSGEKKPVIYNLRSAHCTPMVTLPMGLPCLLNGTEGRLKVFVGEEEKQC